MDISAYQINSCYIYQDDTKKTAHQCEATSKPHSKAEINKALSLLGFNSWSAMEPKGDDHDESNFLKNKLDDAHKEKMDEITEKKKLEEAEKKRFASMTKKEKEIYKNKNRGRLTESGTRRRRKTLLEEERELHEAYQLLLSEHNKRVKKRVKQKLKTVTTLMKMNAMGIN